MNQKYHYTLICKGTRRFVEDFVTKKELEQKLQYYKLPMHLADFSKAEKKNGFYKNAYQFWEVCYYPEEREEKRC